ncbi:MAG: hypothetical protein ACPGEF_07540, partial [Endozoicomonas sp.]
MNDSRSINRSSLSVIHNEVISAKGKVQESSAKAEIEHKVVTVRIQLPREESQTWMKNLKSREIQLLQGASKLLSNFVKTPLLTVQQPDHYSSGSIKQTSSSSDFDTLNDDFKKVRLEFLQENKADKHQKAASKTSSSINEKQYPFNAQNIDFKIIVEASGKDPI